MKAKGFTLIELAIVIVIIGILVAIAVPRFTDLSSQATQAAKEASYGSIRSAYAIAIAQKKGYPTVQEILGKLEGDASFSGGKIQVVIGGTATDIANVYTDDTCTTLANAVGNTVRCITKAF
uniref:Prepilin-type N-terminal cleavage/methylation domain-containing protein n=1 Tax=Thermus caliditerrae TaxID=1330700 RepID=A0A7C5REJ1_9DEIN